MYFSKTTTCLVAAGFIFLPLQAREQKTPDVTQKTDQQGLLAQHWQRYVNCVHEVDFILKTYASEQYYTIDKQNRNIRITKKVSPSEEKPIKKASKELDSLISLLGKCSPGDYSYLEIKNHHLPLLQEMRHRLYTFVMQPLSITQLTKGDHAQRLLIPPVTVAVVISIILLLKKLGVLPQNAVFETKKLLVAGCIITILAILYNYQNEILPTKQEPEVIKILGQAPHESDFAALVQQKHNGSHA